MFENSLKIARGFSRVPLKELSNTKSSVNRFKSLELSYETNDAVIQIAYSPPASNYCVDAKGVVFFLSIPLP